MFPYYIYYQTPSQNLFRKGGVGKDNTMSNIIKFYIRMGMSENEAEAKALADKRARNARDAAVAERARKAEYEAKRAKLAAESASASYCKKNNFGENFFAAANHSYACSTRSSKKHDGCGKSVKLS